MKKKQPSSLVDEIRALAAFYSVIDVDVASEHEPPEATWRELDDLSKLLDRAADEIERLQS